MKLFPAKKGITAAALIAYASCAALATTPIDEKAGEGFYIDWYSINSGASGTSTAGGYQLNGSIGQPVIGLSAGANYQLNAGFWYGRRTGCTSADTIFCNGFEG